MSNNNKNNGTVFDCFKCGKEIERHLSAYHPWDEMFKIQWKAGSDDEKHVEDAGDAGKHPDVQVRRFCSYDCLENFIRMDYEFPDHTQEPDADH